MAFIWVSSPSYFLTFLRFGFLTVSQISCMFCVKDFLVFPSSLTNVVFLLFYLQHLWFSSISYIPLVKLSLYFIDFIFIFWSWTVLLISFHCDFLHFFKGFLHFFSIIFIKAILKSFSWFSDMLGYSGHAVVAFLCSVWSNETYHPSLSAIDFFLCLPQRWKSFVVLDANIWLFLCWMGIYTGKILINKWREVSRRR